MNWISDYRIIQFTKWWHCCLNVMIWYWYIQEVKISEVGEGKNHDFKDTDIWCFQNYQHIPIFLGNATSLYPHLHWKSACLPLKETERDIPLHPREWLAQSAVYLQPRLLLKNIWLTQSFCPAILSHWFSVVCVQPPLFHYVLFILLGMKDKNQPICPGNLAIIY